STRNQGLCARDSARSSAAEASSLLRKSISARARSVTRTGCRALCCGLVRCGGVLRRCTSLRPAPRLRPPHPEVDGKRSWVARRAGTFSQLLGSPAPELLPANARDAFADQCPFERHGPPATRAAALD